MFWRSDEKKGAGNKYEKEEKEGGKNPRVCLLLRNKGYRGWISIGPSSGFRTLVQEGIYRSAGVRMRARDREESHARNNENAQS